MHTPTHLCIINEPFLAGMSDSGISYIQEAHSVVIGWLCGLGLNKNYLHWLLWAL